MKLIKYSLILLLASFIFACEDDPIVEPVYQNDDDCSGSYCKLSFPDSIHVAASANSNPTLF